MPRSAVTAILTVAFLSSCAPQLDRQQVVDPVSIDCGQGVDAWEGVDTAGKAAKCTVYVRLPDPEGSPCRAKLWKYAGAGGALAPVTTNPDGADPTILVTERISKLHVTCEGQAGPDRKCKYEIVKVICDEKPAGVVDKPNTDTLTRVQPACGGDPLTVWTAPEGKTCRVTIRASSSDGCELVLSRPSTPQSVTLVRVPVKARRLVTVVDASSVTGKCDGNATGQKCTTTVVSTECR
jgi:hypothetical protein